MIFLSVIAKGHCKRTMVLFSAGFADLGRLNSKLAAIDILPAGYGGSGRLEIKVLTLINLSTSCHDVGISKVIHESRACK